MPLVLIGIEQAVGRPAIDSASEFPTEIDSVLDAQVQSLAAERRVNMRGVAGQKYSVAPITLSQAGGIPELREPPWRMHTEIGAGHGSENVGDLIRHRAGWTRREARGRCH